MLGKGISRRGFIKGAAVGIGGAALTGFGAGEVVASPLPKKWDRQADVVVMGAGGAGLMAAIQAHDAGAKVIVIQKTQTVFSSSTAVSGGSFAAAGTRAQKEKGIIDSPSRFAEDMLKNGGYMNYPELVKVLSENAAMVFDWLVDNGLPPFRMEASAGQSIIRNHRSNKNSGRDLVETTFGLAKKRNIPILFNTPGVRLFIEQATGRVVGIEAMQKNKRISIKANRAVVLASGGFSRDIQTFDTWIPAYAGRGAMTGDPANAGDGIKMASKYAGSLLTHLQYSGTYPYGIEMEPRQGPVCRYWYFISLGGILVNKEGKRYANEEIRATKLTAFLAEQPGKVHFLIVPAVTWDEVLKKYPPGGVISPSTPQEIKEELKAGRFLIQDDSVRILAQKAGINPDNLEQTVKTFNGYVQAGKDPEFNRDPKTLLRKIEGSPLYAVMMTFATVLTLGGIRVNEKCQALDPYGKVIKGLYAAGETVGGVHGTLYLGGCALAWAHTSGFIAGKNAAGEKA